MRRRPLAACLASHATVLAIAWRKYLCGAHSPYASDIANYHHPVTHELMRAWASGRIPLWTDGVYCGFPFFADPQVAAWYPGTLLIVWLGPHLGYVVFLLLHSLLAAVGTWGWVRSHGGAWSAGWAAGLIVALSGYYAHEAQHPGLFAILAWIPIWLWTSHRVFRRPKAGDVVVAALALAMILFAGTLQVLFGAAILYAFYLLGLVRDARRCGRAVLGPLCGTAAAQVLGLALASIVLLPAIAHLPRTARALGMTYEFASMGSVHPAQLLGLFAKSASDHLGGGIALDFGGASFYLGALTLPLAVFGVLRDGRAVTRSLAVATGLLALLALGRHGALHPLLYEWLPGAIGGVRGIGRALGPATAGLALLAGLGLHRAGAPTARSDRLLPALLGAALGAHALVLAVAPAAEGWGAAGSALVLVAALAIWAGTRRRPAALRQALALLITIDLLAFGALDGVLGASPPPPSAAQLAGAFPPLVEIERDPRELERPRVLLQDFGPRNLPLLRGQAGVGGYNPLVPLAYLDFVSLVDEGRLFPRAPIRGFIHGLQPRRTGAALFDAASIRFVVSGEPLERPGLRLVKHYPRHPEQRKAARLYENERALPAAYLAYRTVTANGPEALERLLGGDFDGRRETVVEDSARRLEGPAAITAVSVARERPEVLRFAVSTEHAAVLVVTDAWYPGWRAWVDGREAPVLRANGFFRAVPVPAGARRVEMRFEPWTFRAGAALSSAAAVALLVLLAFAARSSFGRGGRPVPRPASRRRAGS